MNDEEHKEMCRLRNENWYYRISDMKLTEQRDQAIAERDRQRAFAQSFKEDYDQAIKERDALKDDMNNAVILGKPMSFWLELEARSKESMVYDLLAERDEARAWAEKFYQRYLKYKGWYEDTMRDAVELLKESASRDTK